MKDPVFISMEDYNIYPAIRKTELDYIHQSPAHYKVYKENGRKETDALRWGHLFHTYILEPELFEQEYAVLEESIKLNTTAGKNAWTNWVDANPGKTAVNRPDMEILELMKKSIYDHPLAKNALSGGIAESTLIWEHDGIKCKARPDYITTSGLIVDLKTTKDARPKGFAKDCADYRYHVQSAFYTEGYYQVHGEYPAGFLFVAIEKEKPYAVALYTADQIMDQGYREFMEDLRVYKECLETDAWPAYPPESRSIILPRWAQEAA